MIRFYSPDIAATGLLPEAESAHAVRVLRHRIGDAIEVVDGRGNLYHGVIADDHPKHVLVSVTSSEELGKVWRPELTVAVAPTKNADRMEWLIEKLVEIGIDRFVPVRCEHSERKNINAERLAKIAVSAMKQSLKATLPAIEELMPLPVFLEQCSAAQRFVGYCDADTPRTLLARSMRPDTDTAILIGPEGDFSPSEIEACLQAGFVPVTMGDNRLRTETAALVGADTFHIVNQI